MNDHSVAITAIICATVFVCVMLWAAVKMNDPRK